MKHVFNPSNNHIFFKLINKLLIQLVWRISQYVIDVYQRFIPRRQSKALYHIHFLKTPNFPFGHLSLFLKLQSFLQLSKPLNTPHSSAIWLSLAFSLLLSLTSSYRPTEVLRLSPVLHPQPLSAQIKKDLGAQPKK